jgi:Domain of unknown function (DUF4158)
MVTDWSLEDLISCWTLDEADWRLLANKSGATRLGFAVLLKFLELEGRFPADGAEVPTAALDYIAGQVKVDRSELDGYWSGRAVKYHRAQIRVERGFRESTLDDERRMIVWLAGELCGVELDEVRLRADLLARFREQQIEPPGASRVERIVGSGRALFERRFTATITARLSAPTIEALERLVPAAGDEEVSTAGLLVELKRDPGKASLNTILEEIDKLERVRSLGLPADLFEDCSEKLLAAWRARAAATYPAHLRAMPKPIRITLLAALCWSRTAEITDALVDLLIDVVDKIRVRAENRVEKALVADLKRVRGEQGLFPVVPEATLRQLVKEAKATEQLFRAQVRTEIRGSYSNHYRRMLPRILDALEFRCANTLYRPVMDALALLDRRVETPGQQRFYPAGERVPIDRVLPDEWRDAVIDEHGKIERIPYELCVLRALRDALRRREIYVSGAHRWRNPHEDLPADFEHNRDVHYAAIRKPRDPQAFIADLQARLHAGLERLNHAVATNTAGGVRVTTRRGRPWIVVPAMGQLPDAPNIQALHTEIQRRHGMLDLLEVLKDADHLSDFTAQLTSVASREITDPVTARRRKLLVAFGIGSNIGIKRIAEATDGHPADMTTPDR